VEPDGCVAVSDKARELSGGRLISIAWFLDFCLTGVTVSPVGMCDVSAW
jgi:hypothetical protein